MREGWPHLRVTLAPDGGHKHERTRGEIKCELIGIVAAAEQALHNKIFWEIRCWSAASNLPPISFKCICAVRLFFWTETTRATTADRAEERLKTRLHC
jgi:hypothetical protein